MPGFPLAPGAPGAPVSPLAPCEGKLFNACPGHASGTHALFMQGKLTRGSWRPRRAVSFAGWLSGRRIRCRRRRVHYTSGRKMQHTNDRSGDTQHHLLRFRKRAACADVLGERGFYTQFVLHNNMCTWVPLSQSKNKGMSVSGSWARATKKSQLPYYRHNEALPVQTHPTCMSWSFVQKIHFCLHMLKAVLPSIMDVL